MAQARSTARRPLAKTPSGIAGLDEITGGGLPRGRPTLVCGTAGCGKTLFGLEFLVRGALEHGEPGVLMAFEESAEELAQNVSSLGFDLPKLVAQKKLVIDCVRVERSEIEETGEYDLEALLVRLGYAIDSIGAKRVVLDTLEALFAALPNEFVVRSELRRIFRWLKQKGVTAVITGERGERSITRHGLEEYVSDCVLLLDHRVSEQLSTRRLRVVKYRGSAHGTNEYPFLIDRDGFSVLPITSLGLEHKASRKRVSSGVSGLDEMMEGKGFFRGSTVLISGTAGTGKTSLAAHFVEAACRRGERSLYLAFEESVDQVIRNMGSIGVDLLPHLESGALHLRAARPTAEGLEMHLARIHKAIDEVRPQVVVIDPITNFISVGNPLEVKGMLMRLVDFLKSRDITALFTSLTAAGSVVEGTEVGISSLIDTWILLKEVELHGERNRALYVLKSRGMPHSNQVREFELSSRGVRLIDVYVGPDGVLTGSARLEHEARQREAELDRMQQAARRGAELERKRKTIEAQIAALKAELDADLVELEEEEQRAVHRTVEREKDRGALQSRRQLSGVRMNGEQR